MAKRLYLKKCFSVWKDGCTMELSEVVEDRINIIFVAGLVVLIIVLWFFIIPS